MKIVLLSGESGKKLWLLSNDNRSKQFIKIISMLKTKKENLISKIQLSKVYSKEKNFKLEI